jgi:hypothetical protein
MGQVPNGEFQTLTREQWLRFRDEDAQRIKERDRQKRGENIKELS